MRASSVGPSQITSPPRPCAHPLNAVPPPSRLPIDHLSLRAPSGCNKNHFRRALAQDPACTPAPQAMHKDTDRSTHKRPRYRMIKSRFERRAYDRKEHAKIAHPPRIAGRANLGGGVHMCIYSQSRATKIPSRAKASKRRQREHSTHSSFAIPAVSPFQPQTRLSKPHEAHQVLTTADGKGEGRFRRFGCAARFSSTRKLGVACRGQRESATQERAAVASETRSRLPETSMYEVAQRQRHRRRS
ncbi:hypothetical protein DFP72DRAFT_122483 [Ephemerocybe angulata]|uniref:Uncharacterized protein n=1 Tax=Ephemerocybe angulata TaxID=980116 RepID=A0A8H6LWC7_9AGAR|nr:hypothetical protein DFP72DRAFT_122483 [Tulosesus angulatus]